VSLPLRHTDWGLRDYGTPPQVWDGDPGCEHVWKDTTFVRNNDQTAGAKQRTNPGSIGRDTPVENAFCIKCNAWYGHLGLEPTPSLYVQHLVEICREIKRVLRKDGTFWLNLGDSYAANRTYQVHNTRGASGHTYSRDMEVPLGLKPKDLIGIPWTVALALRDDGWWLRMDNIWAKGCSFGEQEVKCPHCKKKHTVRYSGSVMPESVRDRPTKGHEYVFLFSKSQRYYYNYYAVKEPNSETTGRWGKYTGTKTADAQVETGGRHGASSGIVNVQSKDEFTKKYYTQGRNVRSVWQINSAQFPEAHYAVFPEELVEHPIAASTSDSGCCAECEAPYKRANVKREVEQQREPAHVPGNTDTKVDSTGWKPTTEALNYDEPSCKCDVEDTIPCLVLDPFGGRGTTAVVADRHNCDCILIELGAKYAVMSKVYCKKAGIEDVAIISEKEEGD